ncbi:hypothetical protein [Calothrix sp. NIES-2100]|uniref:hypothetical protein n=1 Tax=Calothrix sp. NIES-2100 TaxID=1954172 RepID=UPI0030DA261E
MKPQKSIKISDLEPASTLLNELDDSELKEVVGGKNYPFGVPLGSPGGPWPIYVGSPDEDGPVYVGTTPVMQRHDSLN